MPGSVLPTATVLAAIAAGHCTTDAIAAHLDRPAPLVADTCDWLAAVGWLRRDGDRWVPVAREAD